jgi:predicted ABC-type transport system involved in lysophospholipase L1 biosynthesis ATPase subunit
VTAPLLRVRGVVKNYHALRPLRLEQLDVLPGQHVAIAGVDEPAAEVLVNLITGTALPDRGEVHVFGTSTATIEDSAAWLATADRFGIVSDRVVLLDAFTVVQNLAIPFSLDVEPPTREIQEKASALAADVGLDRALFEQPVAAIDAPARWRVRLARALAFNPAMLLVEHPSKAIPRDAIRDAARDLQRVAEQRQAAVLILLADVEFATAANARVFKWDAASGRLSQRRGWFGR